jgi:hypothetical protein
MRSHSHPITPQEVYKHAAAVVQPHLKFRDCGPECTANVLLKVLFYAAAPPLFDICRLQSFA